MMSRRLDGRLDICLWTQATGNSPYFMSSGINSLNVEREAQSILSSPTSVRFTLFYTLKGLTKEKIWSRRRYSQNMKRKVLVKF